MSLIGQKIKQNLTVVAYSKFQDYVDQVNADKNPGDPGYIDVNDPTWQANWPDPTDNPNIDRDYTDAIGQAVEDYISGGDGSYLPIPTPVWATSPFETITEVEPGLFRPIVEFAWDPLPSLPIWDAETPYVTGDIVTFGGDSYISTIDDNVGLQPDVNNDQWSLLTSTEIETRIFRKEGSGSFRYVSSVSEEYGESAVSFSDDTVLFNKQYEYKLIRFDSAFRFSEFSTAQTITTSQYPNPGKPTTPPTVSAGRGAVSIQIQPITGTSANIVSYVIETRKALAESSNDGKYSVPTYPNWEPWEVLVRTASTKVIHNEVQKTHLYEYRYYAVTNYGIQGDVGDASYAVIPYGEIDLDALHLSYYAEVFHAAVPTGNSYSQMIHSHSSVDPAHEVNLSSELTPDTYWWKSDTGTIWKRNAVNNAWITTLPIELNLLTPDEYDALVTDTIDIATKTTIVENYKTLVFRKVTLEKFAAKIQDIRENVGFLSFKEKYIGLLDAYYNNFYGLLLSLSEGSAAHDPTYVKKTYREYYNSEIEFSSYLLRVFLATQTRTEFNDNYNYSTEELV